MALDSKIVGSTSGNGAEVDANNQLKVVLSNAAGNTGTVRFTSEVDGGSVTGSPLLRSPRTSLNRHLRVSLGNLFDYDVFHYAAQNTSKHSVSATTQTITFASGGITTNGSAITTNSTGAVLASYRHIPAVGQSSVYAEFSGSILSAIATNSTVDFGLFLPNSSTSAPQDGLGYFRVTSAGVQGVINNNGIETISGIFAFTPDINQYYRFGIVGNNERTEFYIDDVLYGALNIPVGQPRTMVGLGSRVAIQHRIGASSAGSVFQMRFQEYSVYIGDMMLARKAGEIASGAGFNAIQGASGHTQGQTANYTNTAAPSSATLSNTAAGYTTLGGQFQFAAVAGAETDYALFGYQVPNATSNISGRNLVVLGIWIDTMNIGAAVATTGTVLQWAAASGSTAVSLATAEAGGARAPRRIALGIQNFPVGAAIGAQANRVDVKFDTPLVVEPNSFFHIILKMPIGTATASQVIRGVAGVNAYWE